MESIVQIREIDPSSKAEIELVASRMRQTLVEVLGEERGGGMYSMEWLIKRVKWHIDPTSCIGQVFVAQAEDGQIAGHTIVRLDKDFDDQPIGLFSTTYVVPEFRGKGIAKALVERGETWMRDRGMSTSLTYTEPNNRPLLELFKSQGYSIREIKNDFAVLAKGLSSG